MTGLNHDWLKFLLPLALAACSEDGGGNGRGTDTDTDTNTDGSTSSSTSSDTATTGSSSSTTTSSTTSTTSTSTSTSTTGDTTETTGGAAGLCLGLDPLGHFADVLSRNGADVGATCESIPAGCGGDIVGSWTFESSCGLENIANPWKSLCDGATQEVLSLGVVGSISFNPDATFVRETTTSAEFTMSLDAESCFGASCQEFADILNADRDLTAVCQQVDTQCECSVESVTAINIDGVFETAGDEITLVVDGEEEGYTYCVGTDRLDLWTPQFQFTITDTPCADAADCTDALGERHAFYVCDPELER